MEGQKILMTLMGMEIGGAETHVLELCKALTKRGLRVYVASNGGAYEPELEACGIVHYKVPMHNRRLNNIVYAYFALKKIILANGIRLVHAHARIPGFLCGLLQKKLRFRFVTTAHGAFTTEFPYNILSNWGEKSLAVSEDIHRYLLDSYHVPDKNIYVTVNGIDTEKFAPDTDHASLKKDFALEDGQVRILTVSRLDEKSSATARLLIHITPELLRFCPQTKIYIVGDGTEYADIRREADAMNDTLGEGVICMAGQSTTVNQWVAAADIFVGCSRAALEAMSAERPVVASGDEGYLGLLTAENLPFALETNFCFRGGGTVTAESLRADITALLSMDGDARARAGRFGRVVVRKHYSVARMADDALEVYASVYTAPLPPRLAPKYKTDVVISGYYGYNNSGDDMLLRAIIAPLREAQPDMKITVLSRRPKETRLHYGVNAVYRFNFPYVFFTLRKANLLITGGGSLIQDETSTQSLVYYLWLINTARHFGMKNMLYGNGIGPLLNPGNIRRASRALNKTDLITLRDGESLGLLQEIGVTAPETHLTADPAFALPAADEADAQARLAVLGINGPFCCVAIRAWKHNPPHLERTVAAFTDEVSKQYGYSILFVAMNPSEDTEISKNAMQLMKTPSVLLTASPLAKETDRIRGVVGCASLMLGMRLHALIYAMEKSVPMIGLVYDPKIRRLMDTLGQRFYMPVEEADTSEMLRLAETIHADRDACLTGILKAGRQAREKAAVNAKLCAALLARP